MSGGLYQGQPLGPAVLMKSGPRPVGQALGFGRE